MVVCMTKTEKAASEANIGMYTKTEKAESEAQRERKKTLKNPAKKSRHPRERRYDEAYGCSCCHATHVWQACLCLFDFGSHAARHREPQQRLTPSHLVRARC